MSKEDVIEVEGKVIETLPNTTFKVKKEYDMFASVAGFTLETITADGLTFKLNEEKSRFIIDNFIDNKLEEVEVLLTFKKGEQTLTYATKINVLPYTPEYKQADEIPQAFSGSSYDLLKSQFDLSALENDANVQKLLIVGIEDANGQSITNEIVGLFNESGYIKGNESHHCSVVFKDNILNAERKVYVRYQITYLNSNGKTFEDRYELTIKNRQKITVEYPESNLKATSN